MGDIRSTRRKIHFLLAMLILVPLLKLNKLPKRITFSCYCFWVEETSISLKNNQYTKQWKRKSSPGSKLGCRHSYILVAFQRIKKTCFLSTFGHSSTVKILEHTVLAISVIGTTKSRKKQQEQDSVKEKNTIFCPQKPRLPVFAHIWAKTNYLLQNETKINTPKKKQKSTKVCNEQALLVFVGPVGLLQTASVHSCASHTACYDTCCNDLH